jgi:hypothetical protein
VSVNFEALCKLLVSIERPVRHVPITGTVGEPDALACHDCGLHYAGDHWVEAVVPHEVWSAHLSPTGNQGGILCINCMAKRAVDKCLSHIPVKLTAGPFCADPVGEPSDGVVS